MLERFCGKGSPSWNSHSSTSIPWCFPATGYNHGQRLRQRHRCRRSVFSSVLLFFLSLVLFLFASRGLLLSDGSQSLRLEQGRQYAENFAQVRYGNRNRGKTARRPRRSPMLLPVVVPAAWRSGFWCFMYCAMTITRFWLSFGYGFGFGLDWL